MQRLGRAFPVEATVFRRTATDVSRLAFILGALFGFAVADGGQRLSQKFRRRGTELTVQRQRRVIRADRDAFLRHDIAGIGAVNHTVQRHAGFAFAVHQHPVQRRDRGILATVNHAG